MNAQRARLLRTVVTGSAASALVLGTYLPAQAATTVANWQMNETAGAANMLDTSGNGLHGTVGTEVRIGGGFYAFTRHSGTPAAHSSHIVQVPHNTKLNPGNGVFTVEFRYRTTSTSANMIQKGQSGAGSYWKIQTPQGKVSCLFRGSNDSNAIRSNNSLANGAWHSVKCVSSPTKVEMWVDGSYQGINTGNVGTIANTQPVYIGGKGNCNAGTVGCDYFGGDIDYVRITSG